MTLHLFVDTGKELLVTAIGGDEKDARRFEKYNSKNGTRYNLTHIRVDKSGEITIGDD